ncbi:MAG: hypothetical protein U5K51_11260 [Flavobacteriaceae bacterium]|nr:hypothetical protein [Flavobacteriaceae bacterium]
MLFGWDQKTPLSIFKHENELDLKDPKILAKPGSLRPGNKGRSWFMKLIPMKKDSQKSSKSHWGNGMMAKPVKGFNTKTRKFEFASLWAANVKDAYGNPLDVVPEYHEIDPKPTE